MSASSVDSGGGGGGGGDGGSGCGGGGRGVGSSGGGGCCVGSGGDGGRHGGAPPPSPRSECSPLSAADAAALTAVWTSTSCGELVAGQVPVVIPSDATVHDACELLAAHSILSAPVRSADGTGYAGVCTYRSLVKYVLEVFPSRGAGGRESPRGVGGGVGGWAAWEGWEGWGVGAPHAPPLCQDRAPGVDPRGARAHCRSAGWFRRAPARHRRGSPCPRLSCRGAP